MRGFHETEGKYLCTLLSRLLHLDTVEKEFVAAGIYFDDETLSKIQKSFVELMEQTVSNHKLDKDLLILLSSATLRFEDAFDSYFDDKFDMLRIIERTVNNFMHENGIDPYYGAEDFLKRFILEQVQYKRIKFNKLKSEYKDRYYYELFGRFRQETKKQKSKYSQEVRKLLEFFGLDENADNKTLKLKYKELLKKYHPDLNKEGLEKTKLIISNYKKLHTILPSG
jgi:hypothetical protein